MKDIKHSKQQNGKSAARENQINLVAILVTSTKKKLFSVCLAFRAKSRLLLRLVRWRRASLYMYVANSKTTRDVANSWFCIEEKRLDDWLDIRQCRYIRMLGWLFYGWHFRFLLSIFVFARAIYVWYFIGLDMNNFPCNLLRYIFSFVLLGVCIFQQAAHHG